VTAVGFGALAALMWGLGALVSVKQVRALGAWASLLWMMTIGLLLIAPVAPAVGVPHASASSWAYGAASGVGYVAASAFWYLAVQRSRVSLLTPIVSTDGAVAAVISIAAFGEALRAGVAVALTVVVLGIVLASLRPEPGHHGGLGARGVLLALGAAGGYGFSFVAGAQAAGLGTVWTLFVSRLAATAIVLPPMLLTRRVTIPRRTLLYPLLTALTDVAGYAAFLHGAGSSVAVTSVLASQYAVVAVIGGIVVFRERLSPLQATGVAVTLGGVAALALLRA
jgi:glucose uptake protein